MEKNLESSYIKPLFKNSDIKKYYTSIDNAENIFYYQKNEPEENIKNIIMHLTPYKNILLMRREAAKWSIRRFDLWWPRKSDIFEDEKIVCPQRSNLNIFWYNNIPRYASVDVYFITNPNEDYKLKYLLAILNSKLYYVRLYYKWKRKWESLELYQKPLSEIPIKKISLEEQQPFIDLVDNIIEKKKSNLEADTSDLERQIDQMVYELYWLTDEEIQIVEDSVK